MKKLAKTIFLLALCAFITACGNVEIEEENYVSDVLETETELSTDEETTENVQEQSTTLETEQVESNDAVTKLSERPTQAVEDYLVLAHINDGLILYVPNEDNTKLVCVPWDRGELADNRIVEELIARGVLPTGASIDASFSVTPKTISVGKTIEEYLCTLTPEQEDLVMASLVLSIGANNGQREVVVYSRQTDELLVTNNYEYDVPVSPDYYYELLQGAVGEDVQGMGGMDNVELGNGE